MKSKIIDCPWGNHDAIAYKIDGITSIYCPECPGSVGDKQFDELQKIFTTDTTRPSTMPQESFSFKTLPSNRVSFVASDVRVRKEKEHKTI